MSDQDVDRLWDAYIAAERDRIRDVTLSALDRFIEALLSQPTAVWMQWANDLACRHSDLGVDIPVRFPLFRRVLLPALTQGVVRQEPGAARWLAHFWLLLFHSDPGELPADLQSQDALLREALRVDPSDVRARERIIRSHVSRLEYTLHELPVGVLYGQNGATADECVDLLGLLEEFEGHVQAAGRQADFAELIADCQLHYRLYREYLLAGRPGGSYEEFVAGRACDSGA